MRKKLVEAARNWNIVGPAADQFRMQGPLALEVRAKHADGEYLRYDFTRRHSKHNRILELFYQSGPYSTLRVEVKLPTGIRTNSPPPEHRDH